MKLFHHSILLSSLLVLETVEALAITLPSTFQRTNSLQQFLSSFTKPQGQQRQQQRPLNQCHHPQGERNNSNDDNPNNTNHQNRIVVQQQQRTAEEKGGNSTREATCYRDEEVYQCETTGFEWGEPCQSYCYCSCPPIRHQYQQHQQQVLDHLSSSFLSTSSTTIAVATIKPVPIPVSVAPTTPTTTTTTTACTMKCTDPCGRDPFGKTPPKSDPEADSKFTNYCSIYAKCGCTSNDDDKEEERHDDDGDSSRDGEL